MNTEQYILNMPTTKLEPYVIEPIVQQSDFPIRLKTMIVVILHELDLSEVFLIDILVGNKSIFAPRTDRRSLLVYYEPRGIQLEKLAEVPSALNVEITQLVTVKVLNMSNKPIVLYCKFYVESRMRSETE